MTAVHQGPAAANTTATIAKTPTRNKLLMTKALELPESLRRSPATVNSLTLR